VVKQHNQLMLALLGLADLSVTAAAAAAAYAVSWGVGLIPADLPGVALAGALAVCLAVTPLVFSRCDLYRPRRTAGLGGEWADVARGCMLAWLLTVAAAAFLLPIREAWPLPVLFAVTWVAGMGTFRTGVRLGLRWARRRGWNLRSAAIVGDGASVSGLLDELHGNPWTGIRVRYVVADGPAGEVAGVPVAGPVDRLAECFAAEPVELVFVALPAEQQGRTPEVLNTLAGFVTDVCFVPDMPARPLLRRQVSQLGTTPIVSLTHTPQEGWNCLLKRGFDVIGSLAALVLFCPVMLAAAVAVRLSGRGPVLYRQVRAGLGGRPFRMLKFRTMAVGAEDATGPVMASPNDPRVTRVGRLLRRTSLDELPQLLNVLAGQMSLVGPRPERPELIERFAADLPRYLLRQQVKAGMTGLAQVRGLRGQTSIRRRIRYDVFYINNWTFGLDLRILLLTLVRGFIHPNAY